MTSPLFFAGFHYRESGAPDGSDITRKKLGIEKDHRRNTGGVA